MLITFPHMGQLHTVMTTLITGFGHDVLVPPPISRTTLALGVRHSPETVCLPFKMNLGNFIEALDQGADTILTCGGVGPCRLGCYAQVQEGILCDMGYRFQMLAVEPNLPAVFALMRRLCAGAGWSRAWRALRLAYDKMLALDGVERRLAALRPREMVKGTADRAATLALKGIEQADNEEELRRMMAQAAAQLDEIVLDPHVRPLRVGLVGEIYVMLEPFANCQLEKHLGRMGVEVHKTLNLSDYVRGHILRQQHHQRLYRMLDNLARPYLGHFVGGHGLKSIAYTVQKSREKLDGMIQAYPFTCMPEAIAKNILPTVSRQVDMPVLSLAFDEQSGEAGLVTRLEAFVDLLQRRRAAGAGQ